MAKQGTEYGGVPGIIQPRPHSIEDSVVEQLGLAVRTDSADSTSGIEQQYTDEMRLYGKRRVT